MSFTCKHYRQTDSVKLIVTDQLYAEAFLIYFLNLLFIIKTLCTL